MSASSFVDGAASSSPDLGRQRRTGQLPDLAGGMRPLRDKDAAESECWVVPHLHRAPVMVSDMTAAAGYVETNASQPGSLHDDQAAGSPARGRRGLQERDGDVHAGTVDRRTKQGSAYRAT
ncbi:hypothetical protein ACFTZI_01810 [Streptomyces decoyicus]|uniref:hypothetical protein n=1 Tax=Streptomyces decoyicus TaxID=249567 RepID=UPI00362B515C